MIDTKIEERLKSQEDKFMKELRRLSEEREKEAKSINECIKDLSGRLNLIEMNSKTEPVRLDRGASKRARSCTSTPNSAQRPCAVLCGFPRNSRKHDIEKFVKEQLQRLHRWKDVDAFAPGVRSSCAIVRFVTHEDVQKFIGDWKGLDAKYNGDVEIKAKNDEPPQKRKSKSMIYQIKQYLVSNHGGVEFDHDYKNDCVWHGDKAIVKWSIDAEMFVWDDEAAASINIDKEAAVRSASQ
jgi:hypothetical protein